MNQLKALMRDNETYQISIGAYRVGDSLAIQESELERKVAELAIYDLRPFFKSRTFQKGGFVLDKANGIIVRHF